VQKGQTPMHRGTKPRNITFQGELSRQPQVNARRVQGALIVHLA
jgi:hypothetical protein